MAANLAIKSERNVIKSERNVNTIENDARNYLFDNIKAILIFSVVLAHYFRASSSFSLPTFGGVAYIISFSYIMQGFLFVSGYFSRNLKKCRSTAFRTFLFPYIVLMPIMFCIRYLIFGRANFDLTLPTMALWYLLTLFFYRFFLKDLVKINKILPISIGISLIAGFVPFFDSTLSFGRTFSFLPFFLMGYYFKESWIEKIRKIPGELALVLLALLIGISVYIACKGLFPVEALYMKAPYASTGLDNYEGIAVRIAISLISIAWMVVFINLTPKHKTFFSAVGQKTMTIYVMHIVVRYVVKGFGGYFEQDVFSYMILISAAVISIWIFSRPAADRAYQKFINPLYQWVISIPQALIRQIL